MARRYSDEQTQQFVKQYKENRKKGYKDYKNNSAGGYAGDATGSRLHALTLGPKKQKRTVKEFDNSDMYVGAGQSWYDQTHPQENEPVVYSSDNELPELKTSSKNLRDQGFPGSMNNNQIDFKYMLTNAEKDDFNGNGIYGSSLQRLDEDLASRNKERNRSDFVSEFLPFLSGMSYANSEQGKEAERAENEAYYRKFGMSKDQVLDQYEAWKEAQEQKNREDHFVTAGLKDFPSAPDRAVLGGAKNLAQKFAENSTLADIISHPFVQGKNEEVERHRDYTQNSEKLSEGKKNLAKMYGEMGDYATIKALEGLLGSYGAVGDASAGIGFEWAGNKALAKGIGAGLLFGSESENTRHELENRGVDSDKALDMANLAGLGAAGTDLLMGKAFKAGEGILTSALKSAGLMGTKQSLKEIADKLILQDQGTYASEVQNYMAQGLSEEEAGRKASWNLLGRVLGSAATGGIVGGISGLVGKLPSMFNSDPGTALAVQGGNDDGLNTVFGDFQKALGTQNAGLIEEYTGLPGLPQLSDSGDIIQLPNTSSGAPIQLPNTSSGPAIELPELQLPELAAPSVSTSARPRVRANTPSASTSAPANVASETATNVPAQSQTVTMPAREDGTTPNYADMNEVSTRLNTSKQRIKEIDTELKRLDEEYQKVIALKKNAKNRAILSKQMYTLEQEKKQAEQLVKILNKVQKGKAPAVKDVVQVEYPWVYSRVYGREGVLSDIAFARHFAGNTEEAQRLAQETRDLLYKYLKGGTQEDLFALGIKARELDNLAKETNAEYVTHSKKGGRSTRTYQEYFGYNTDATIPERGLIDDIADSIDYFEQVNQVARALQKPTEVQNKVPDLTEHPEQIVNALEMSTPEDDIATDQENINDLVSSKKTGSIETSNGQFIDKYSLKEMQDAINSIQEKNSLSNDEQLDIYYKDGTKLELNPGDDVSNIRLDDIESAVLRNSSTDAFYGNVNIYPYSYDGGADHTRWYVELVQEPDSYYDIEPEEIDIPDGVTKQNAVSEFTAPKSPNNQMPNLTEEKPVDVSAPVDVPEPVENTIPNLEQPLVDDRQSYYLRLLGDDAFLQEQARINGTTPAELKALASYNLGYGDLPDLGEPTPQTPPPAPEPTPNAEGPKQKTSQYYNSTMRNTETNQDMTDAEYAQHFNKSDYSYTPKSQKQSVDEAQSLIKSLGGVEKATKALGNPSYFEGREFTGVHLDALETLADIAERKAMSLDLQGLNSTEAWRDANRLHQMAKRGLSNSAQAMQASQKWKKPSPRAQVDRLAAEINAAIDKKKTKGYTNMVNDLATAVEDAITKGGSTEDIIARVRQVFEENGKKSDYNTKKIAEKVIKYIRNAEKNPDLVEEASNIIKKNMGVSTMTYRDEIDIAELLEQAAQYQPGTRAYDLLVAQAMARFDETLPPDSLGAKVKSVIYDNMLASIRTMMTRNMGGNLGNAFIDTLERPLMVGADVFASKFTGNRTRSLTGKAIVEGLYGFRKGFAEWANDIKEGVNTGRSGQKDLETILAQNHKTFRTNSNNKIVKGANIAFHVYDRLVKKGMEGGDRPIYEMRYAQTKAELMDVVDRFGDEGLRKGLGLEGAKDMDVNDLIEFIATGEALEAVLQNDSSLKEGAKALKSFFKKSSEGILGVDVASLSMAPFVEVPANMADVMFQHTPVGAVANVIKSIKERRKYGSVNQRRMTKEAGRNIGGALLTAGTMGLAAKAMISGPLSKDKDEKKVQQNNGFQEYALQNPEGTTQVDISDIPILGPYVQYGKRLYDAYEDTGVKGMAEEMIPALGAVTVDQLYQSLNRLTGGSMRASSSGNFLENAIDALAAGATSMVVPSIVRQTAQYTDPYKRDLGDYGTKEYYKNLLINGIPGLREKMLDPKIDTSGNYVPELGGKTGIQRVAAAYATPWKVSHPYDNMSDVQKYAMELNLASDGEVNPQTPVFNKNDLVSTKGYDEAGYKHADLREATEEFYNTNAELGSLLINQSWFRELSPELQGKYLDKLFSANKANTKYNAVRKGLSDEEIKAKEAADELYQTDNGLAKTIREDNDAHTKMLTWIRDQAAVDALNEKYGTDMSHSTYSKKENEQAGSGEKWAQDAGPAHELGYDVGDYQRYEQNYPGGAKQRKIDEGEAQKHNLSLDQYNKMRDKAGANFDAALSAADQLRKRGYDNYNMGLDFARSDFPMDEFVDLYRQIDTNYNQAFTQKEVLDYLKANNIDDELAQRIWKIGGFKSKDKKKDTLLRRNAKSGKWEAYYEED